MTSAVPPMSVAVDRLAADEEAEDDPDDRQEVRDHRRARRAPAHEQPEIGEVRETRAEDPEPDDREPRLEIGARGLPRSLREQRQQRHDRNANVTWNTAGISGGEPADVPSGVHVADRVRQRRAEQGDHPGGGAGRVLQAAAT